MSMRVKGSTAEAMGAELGLDASAVKVLDKILKEARKSDPEMPGDINELDYCVYWSSRNLLKGAEAKIATQIVEAIRDYQERASAKPSKGGEAVALVPKVHAQLTFYPTKKFREECGVEHEDVGLFLDTDEAVLLADATVKAGAKRTVVKIPQGKIEVNPAEWDIRTGAKKTALKKYQVREWSWIETEYRQD